MVEQVGEGFSEIFQRISLQKEINPICMHIEDMLARLDEFDTLLASVKAENNSIMDNHVKSILEFSGEFNVLKERIDNLEEFIAVVAASVRETEKSLDFAEEELNVIDYSFKGLLLRPLLAKTKAGVASETDVTLRTNLKNGIFQKIKIFNTDDYIEKSYE